jgi:DNA-binding MarR family transcriptional regulator
LAEAGTATMKSLADKLKVTPPSTTTIIDALIRKSLVKREMNAKDRRVIRISLTPKAWKFFTKLKNQKLNILQNIFNELKLSDKNELIRILSILAQK